MYVNYVDCTATGRRVTVAPTSGEESAPLSRRESNGRTGGDDDNGELRREAYFSSCLTALILPSSSSRPDLLSAEP